MIGQLIHWWTNPGGILSWVEANQGLVSVLSIAAAWLMVVHQQKAALLAEARSNERARLAKEEGAREEREAALDRKLQQIGEFAIAARGVLLDIVNRLHAEQPLTRALMVDGLTMSLTPETTVVLRASADTLAALISASHLTPGMVRRVRDSIAVMLEIEATNAFSASDFEAVYETWIDKLHKLVEQISDEERALMYQLRPPPPPLPAPLPDQQF
ncbi:hypothetical protein [Caulobacter soli]|uniref:hypothetical protein n=1 Tax=Caulobacter soli TaxID=2708539 RepID=UPI0013ECA6EF|nr:hypothetical protein [Caulobacter soli]